MEHPRIVDIHDNCTGCGACKESCKKGCITMVEDNYGFYTPQIDLAECIMCGACSNSCHVLSDSGISSKPVWWNKSSLWAYQSNDKKLVENSTSGGAFSLFAAKVLEEGGIVFASRYNGETERLEFADTDHFELEEFRKSRYMESYTNYLFSSIKTCLRNDRIVLFCGTPCQVAGLNRFLGKTNKEKLVTINFICHGVPSNKFFHQWLRFKFPHIGRIKNVDFRYKNAQEGWGWHDMCLSIKEETNRLTNIPYTQSSYYLSFCNNDLLRKCCYNCKIINGLDADVTLGDFWGVKNHQLIKDDNKGLSLVIVHTPKAEAFLDRVKTSGLLVPLEYSDVDYAFHPREYSIQNRVLSEQAVQKYGFVKFVEQKYKWLILKYKAEKLFNLQKLIKWVKR